MGGRTHANTSSLHSVRSLSGYSEADLTLKGNGEGKEKSRAEIIEEARKKEIPRYIDATETLGVGGSVHAMSGSDPDTVGTKLDGYGHGGFFISGKEGVGEWWEGPVMALGRVNLMWRPRGKSVKQLLVEDLEVIKHVKPTPDLIILGTGSSHRLPSQEVQDFFNSISSFEIMDTVHAIGVHNMLLEEDRRVITFLLPISEDPVALENEKEEMPPMIAHGTKPKYKHSLKE